jgi:hypothetical protein
VQRTHALERSISEIERRTANKGRASVMKFLRSQLRQLRNKLHRYRSYRALQWENGGRSYAFVQSTRALTAASSSSVPFSSSFVVDSLRS